MIYPNIHISPSGVKYLFARPDYMADEITGSGATSAFHAADYLGLTHLEGDVVLDIGAHFGGFSIPYAVKYPNVTVHAFEPQDRLFYELCANIAINDLRNLIPHNIACSDGPDLVYYYDNTDSKNPGATRMQHERTGHRQLVAPCTQIDNYNFSRVSLMKIDVEGMEELVINGAIKTITAHRPVILLESWAQAVVGHDPATRDRIVQRLGLLGYRATELGLDDIVLTPPTSLR